MKSIITDCLAYARVTHGIKQMGVVQAEAQSAQQICSSQFSSYDEKQSGFLCFLFRHVKSDPGRQNHCILIVTSMNLATVK